MFSSGICNLFGTKKLAAFTSTLLILYCASSASAMAYIFEISEMTGSLCASGEKMYSNSLTNAGHPSVKFFFYGLARVWIPFAIFGLDRWAPKFGRRAMLLYPMALITTAHIVVAVTNAVRPNETVPLSLPFLVAGCG